jgi:NAD+ diphosphatase
MPFSGNLLDRAQHERRDAAWLAEQIESPRSRFLPFSNLNVLVEESESPSLIWLDTGVRRFLADGAPPLLLGLRDGVAHFAVDVSALEDPIATMGLEGARFAEVRGVALRLPPEDAGIVAHGRALVGWHLNHRFCGVCGAPTSIREAGASRQCDSCGANHFPRTDPVVIMVVWRGERCVLGRRASGPYTRYSCLAGYIDQGETIEEAVRREVSEEVGLAVDEVRYYASQPWPFPSTLMIGCFAHATGDEIEVDKDEIDEARWFTREELETAIYSPGADNGFAVPERIAIAHHLIRAWLENPPRERE